MYVCFQALYAYKIKLLYIYSQGPLYLQNQSTMFIMYLQGPKSWQCVYFPNLSKSHSLRHSLDNRNIHLYKFYKKYSTYLEIS
jgi:hypothetical protein